jgi:polysaccharide export outer membrane protein
MNLKESWFLSCTLLFFISVLYSCTSTKHIPYFSDVPDSVHVKDIPTTKFVSPVIQPDDNLNITIQTLDPVSSSAINNGNTPNMLTSSSNLGSASPMGNTMGPQYANSYLVDANGNVALPLLGTVHLAGLTTQQARDSIRQKALYFVKDPTVSVRFTNFKVSVLGEVTRPAAYTLPNEKVSILDAISYAGDLTIFGKRENVLLIRQDSTGQSKLVRLNLNSSDLFRSPYFYLKQNDVVYVEPNKAKLETLDATRTRNITIISAGLSLLIVLLTRIN